MYLFLVVYRRFALFSELFQFSLKIGIILRKNISSHFYREIRFPCESKETVPTSTFVTSVRVESWLLNLVQLLGITPYHSSIRRRKGGVWNNFCANVKLTCVHTCIYFAVDLT